MSPACLGRVPEELGPASDDTVCAAYDAGINFFFISADLHWPAYELQRRGILKLLARGKPIRNNMVIAAACYSGFHLSAVADLLTYFPQLGRIDVLVVGAVGRHDDSRIFDVCHKYRVDHVYGTRAVGMSFHDRERALLAVNNALLDIAFARYNPQHPGARRELFPFRTPNSTLLYNFKSTFGAVTIEQSPDVPTTDELWRPKITDYYRFVLTRPEVDGVLCKFRTPAEVTAFAQALEEGPLSQEEEQYLIDLSALAQGKSLTFEAPEIGGVQPR